MRVAATRAHRLPFDGAVPNAATRATIAELQADGGTKHITIEGLMADLRADD